eukprot:11618951-Prorocentrum_lima.AAC.1
MCIRDSAKHVCPRGEQRGGRPAANAEKRSPPPLSAATSTVRTARWTRSAGGGHALNVALRAWRSTVTALVVRPRARRARSRIREA